MIPAEHIGALRRALRRLERSAETGSDRARRTARAALAAAIRKIRAEVDAAYPAPARRPGKRRSPKDRVAQLRRDGWDELVPGTDRVVELAARGIRVVRVKMPDVGGTVWVTQGVTRIFAPPWTKDVPAEKLGAARKSVTARHAIKAAIKLRRDHWTGASP